ncbi:hypothetical protein J3E07_000399 [Methanococcus voltae]|uniref:Uncharacterized protein n=1 Tax=Methanococcus voltae TaxID=2188 RepID=A0A8J7UU64_METVO|nr:hypothetical protein [Methanococcus voltae]
MISYIRLIFYTMELNKMIIFLFGLVVINIE